MKTRIAILLALAAAGCKIKNSSALVITKVVQGKPSTTGGTGGPSICLFDPSDTELDFIRYNPAENVGFVGAVVQNNIQPTTSVNSQLRTDASTFLPHQAVVDYELVGGGTSPGQRIVPVSGIEVPGSGGSGPVIVPLLPAGVMPAGVAAGTFVRVTFHFEGKLVDGSTVHTSEREFLFNVCTAPGCAGNTCL